MKRTPTIVLILGALLAASVATGSWALAKDSTPPPANTHDRPVTATPKAVPVYQAPNETRYVSVPPCTVADTAKKGGRLQGKVRRLVVAGSTGFTGQGGAASGCGVPGGAVAVQLNFVLAKAKKSGNLLVGAAGGNPKLVVATFVKGKAATGSANVAIDGSVPGSAAVRVTAGAPYLKMQVSGYYEKPLAGFISPSGAPYAGSSRILGATRVGTGVYEVQFDRNIRYCASTVTPYVSAYFASASTWYDSTRPDTVRVWLWDASGTPQDQYFYIDVEC